MTSFDSLLPLLVLMTSLVTAVIIFALGEDRIRARTFVNLLGAVAKLALVGYMIWGLSQGRLFETRWPFMPQLDFVLRADSMTILFSTLSAGLWLLTTIYAIGYLEGSPNRRRFFGYFSLCVTSTMGISLAGNLITFFVFYELLTLTTYPLVVHRGTEKAVRAGSMYLRYTLAGSASMLAGMLWLYVIAGPFDFRAAGVLAPLGDSHRPQLIAIFALLVGGLGVKAAIVPLHKWLPTAMVAPAPVSALLHAVAVVKAGAFGIVRVVYDVYGAELARDLGVLTPLAAFAAITILYGSLRALAQDDFKRRLAFSTVSQVSYITLGVSLFGPMATMGGLVHLVHQGIMKITMFFAAGNAAEALGVHKISELDGVGRRLPGTMASFTIAALGMIGVPPLAGFVSKWYLGWGAAEAGQYWALGVLAASSLLNAAYFLPILYRAWFKPQRHPWPHEHPHSGRLEISWWLLFPPVATAALVLIAGLFAGHPFSPLSWVQIITRQEYPAPGLSD
ncbi:MAG: monovalent cation/H+ antiporter subunit D family protein [Kiritimatiellae bacterium]|nr:monovalent cation/H+ antiporter subunit D family protein [Kiritimatiellia bacterium]MDW8457786.1 proton-conducting transporter membrane subunit [Verrucomicrobiota bacterium]